MANIIKYYVIRFLYKAPHRVLKTCVPHSWIRKFYEEDKVLLVYPVKDHNVIHQYLLTGEIIDTKWETYTATVLHETDDYIKGLIWMAGNHELIGNNTSVKNNIGYQSTPYSKKVTHAPLHSNKNTCAKSQIAEPNLPVFLDGDYFNPRAPENPAEESNVENGNKNSPKLRNKTVTTSASVPKPPCRTTRNPQQKTYIDKSVCAPGKFNEIRSSSYNIDHRQPSVEQNPSTSLRTNNDSQLQDPQTAVHQPSPIPSIRISKKQRLSQSIMNSSNGMSRKRKRDSDDVCNTIDLSKNIAAPAFRTSMESTKSIVVEDSDEEMPEKETTIERSNDANDVRIENNTGNVSVVPHSSYVHENTEKIVLENCEVLFAKIENITDTLEMFKGVVKQSIVQFADVVKQVKETLNELCESKLNEIEVTASTSSKMTENPNEIIKEADDSDDEDNDSNCVGENEELEIPAKKRREENAPRDALLPEYNSNDSSWTLRHKNASKNVVEIIPKSRVYIDKKKFERYKQNATDYNMLARNLMYEVFSDIALRICSLKGKKSRPGLDERALTVILDFVRLHGQAKNWPAFEQLPVTNSLGSKLYSLRLKQKFDVKNCTQCTGCLKKN